MGVAVDPKFVVANVLTAGPGSAGDVRLMTVVCGSICALARSGSTHVITVSLAEPSSPRSSVPVMPTTPGEPDRTCPFIGTCDDTLAMPGSDDSIGSRNWVPTALMPGPTSLVSAPAMAGAAGPVAPARAAVS